MDALVPKFNHSSGEPWVQRTLLKCPNFGFREGAGKFAPTAFICPKH